VRTPPVRRGSPNCRTPRRPSRTIPPAGRPRPRPTTASAADRPSGGSPLSPPDLPSPSRARPRGFGSRSGRTSGCRCRRAHCRSDTRRRPGRSRPRPPPSRGCWRTRAAGRFRPGPTRGSTPCPDRAPPGPRPAAVLQPEERRRPTRLDRPPPRARWRLDCLAGRPDFRGSRRNGWIHQLRQVRRIRRARQSRQIRQILLIRLILLILPILPIRLIRLIRRKSRPYRTGGGPENALPPRRTHPLLARRRARLPTRWRGPRPAPTPRPAAFSPARPATARSSRRRPSRKAARRTGPILASQARAAAGTETRGRTRRARLSPANERSLDPTRQNGGRGTGSAPCPRTGPPPTAA